MQLVCFPHAGGFSSYYSFLVPKVFGSIDDIILYEYPGRMTRSLEQPFKNCDEAVSEISKFLHENINDDYVLFGYSMGAFFAYETALHMQEKYKNPPKLVIISSQVSPSGYEPIPKEECKDDDFLTRYIYSMGGLDSAIANNRSVMNFFLKNIRDDLHMIENYTPTIDRAKKVPSLAVVYGTKDKILENSNVDDWSQVTNNYMGSFAFDGGHFFIQEYKQSFIELLDDLITEIAEGRER